MVIGSRCSCRCLLLNACAYSRRSPCVGSALCGCSFDLGSFSLGAGQGSDAEAAGQADRRDQPGKHQDAQGHAAQGQALARSGKTDEALAEFEKALALDPYNVQALNGRGRSIRAKSSTPKRSRIFPPRMALRRNAPTL